MTSERAPVDGIDPLDAAIAAKAARLADLEREVEAAQSELRTLQYAATLRPYRPIVPYPSSEGMKAMRAHLSSGSVLSAVTGPAGRQVGAVSKVWRKTMEVTLRIGTGSLTENQWKLAAKIAENPVSEKALIDWLKRGAARKAGFIEQDGDTYRVSQSAIDKFAFKASQPLEEVSQAAE